MDKVFAVSLRLAPPTWPKPWGSHPICAVIKATDGIVTPNQRVSVAALGGRTTDRGRRCRQGLGCKIDQLVGPDPKVIEVAKNPKLRVKEKGEMMGRRRGGDGARMGVKGQAGAISKKRVVLPVSDRQLRKRRRISHEEALEESKRDRIIVQRRFKRSQCQLEFLIFVLPTGLVCGIFLGFNETLFNELEIFRTVFSPRLLE